MARSTFAVFLLVGLIPGVTLSQNVGKLAGRVHDAVSGEPLPGATVVIENSNLGAATGIRGEYYIVGVPVGIYTVRASFVGYTDVIYEGVEINQGFTRELDFELESATELFEEIVVEYEKPLIRKDAIGAPRILTSTEIETLPVRGVDAVAAIQGGVLVDENDDLHFRAGRSGEVVYFVDGVKIIGETAVPQQAIGEQEMLIGSLPAKYGDAMSGVISVTTKRGASEFFGSLEGITSQGLDAYGYNLGAFSLGGPISGDRLSFFVAGEFTHQDDWQPSAIDIPRLREDRLAALQQNPQALRFVDAEGKKVFLPLPNDAPRTVDTDGDGVADGITLEDVLSAMDIPGGLTLDVPATVSAAEAEPLSSYEFAPDRPGYFLDNLVASGNLTYTAGAGITVRLTSRYQNSERSWIGRRRILFNSDRLERGDDETFEVGGTWTQRLSSSTFYQVHGEYSRYRWVQYDPLISDDVNDLLLYEDIDHPANVIATRFVTWSLEDSAYVPRFRDGFLPTSSGVFGTFSEVGSGIGALGKEHSDRFRMFANATTQLGKHQIEFGGEYERRIWRRYAGFDVGLARHFDDGDVEAEPAVSEYAALPYSAVSGVEYFGFDYLGLEATDSGDIDTFISGIQGVCNEPSPTPHPSCNTPPYKPILYAGYVQDKIEYRDLVLNLGLRVDVFDANTIVLKDPFALVPIVRAESLPSVPANIGPEFAVYFGGNGEVAGFRDLEGNFFDSNGEDIVEADILNVARPAVPEGVQARLSSAVFEDYSPVATWMPRVGVSFPVTDRSLFFAHYDRTSQQPMGGDSGRILSARNARPVFPGLNEYFGATQGFEFLENASLKPPTTTEYELGFRIRMGQRSAFLVSGFYKKIDGLIQFDRRDAAFPSSYVTVGNEDFATIKGVQAEFDLRRTGGFSANANYTLQFAEGTGSHAFSSQRTSQRPDFLFPLNFDQRHSINLNLDYRLGKDGGPSIAGARLLENLGVNVVASFRSGRPYTPRAWPAWQVTGSLNGNRMPWSSLVNLRVDRRFDLSSQMSMTVFVWIQNLLDTENAVIVYPTTGLPGDDGRLATDWGTQFVETHETRVCGGGCDGEIGERAATLHGYWINNPFHYGIPRLARLGIRFNL